MLALVLDVDLMDVLVILSDGVVFQEAVVVAVCLIHFLVNLAFLASCACLGGTEMVTEALLDLLWCVADRLNLLALALEVVLVLQRELLLLLLLSLQLPSQQPVLQRPPAQLFSQLLFLQQLQLEQPPPVLSDLPQL